MKAKVYYNCNKNGHNSRDCKADKNQCYYCNKLDHIAPHCRLPKKSKSQNSTVRVGEGKELKALGIGTIELATVTYGELVKIEICDVLFVPEMRVNQISIEKLLKRGFDGNFENSKCQIRFNEELVAEYNPWVEIIIYMNLRLKREMKIQH